MNSYIVGQLCNIIVYYSSWRSRPSQWHLHCACSVTRAIIHRCPFSFWRFFVTMPWPIAANRAVLVFGGLANGIWPIWYCRRLERVKSLARGHLLGRRRRQRWQMRMDLLCDVQRPNRNSIQVLPDRVKRRAWRRRIVVRLDWHHDMLRLRARALANGIVCRKHFPPARKSSSLSKAVKAVVCKLL